MRVPVVFEYRNTFHLFPKDRKCGAVPCTDPLGTDSTRGCSLELELSAFTSIGGDSICHHLYDDVNEVSN